MSGVTFQMLLAKSLQVIGQLLDHQSSTASGTSHTFNTNFGAGGNIAVCIQTANAISGPTISSVTIGGVTATQVVHRTNSVIFVGGLDIAIYIAGGVASGAGDVVVNTSSTCTRWGMQSYTLTGNSSNTADSTANSIAASPTATLNVPKGSFVIGCAMDYAGSPTATSWSGITEDVDDNPTSGFLITSASAQVPGGNSSLSTTATFNAGTSVPAGVWAVWKP